MSELSRSKTVSAGLSLVNSGENLGFATLDRFLRHPLTILILATIAAVACGLILHPRGLALAGGLALVVVLGLLWPWLSLWGVGGRLEFEPLRAQEGDQVPAHLTLRHRTPWGAWGLSVRLGRSSSGRPAVLSLSHLGGWQTEEIRWSFVPDCRGEHPLGGAWLATGFPFGLHESSRRLDVERTLLVWPRTFPVLPLPEEAGGEVSEGTSFRDRPGDVGDLLGVRPYRRGDPIRRVHWAQTARYGELIVCERQAAAAPRVQVVLDLDSAAHVGSGSDRSVEWAIRIAGSLLDGWIAEGAEAQLIMADQVISPVAGSMISRRQMVLDSLAKLDVTRETIPLAELLARPAYQRFGRGLRVVICTDLARIDDRSLADERLIVLASRGFSAPDSPQSSKILPAWRVRPWIGIESPEQVPTRLKQHRLSEKEALDVG